MRLHTILAKIIIALVLAAAPSTARAQETDEADKLSHQVAQLYSEGKYAEAAPLAERALAL